MFKKKENEYKIRLVHVAKEEEKEKKGNQKKDKSCHERKKD